MLTFFTTPKSFQGHFEIIQRNAIQSWLKLWPDSEVILFGNDNGTAEAAAEFGIRHVAEIACNEYGTPLLNDLFYKVQHLATHNLLCYVNADIILMSDFVRAVERVVHHKHHFLMIGARWDLDIEATLDFGSGWEEQLRVYAKRYGAPQAPAGMDYFVFSPDLWGEIPPFAIGRTFWDNWLVYQARLRRKPVVDASQVVLAVHQNHDYSHNKLGTGNKESVWDGAEAKYNLELAGDEGSTFRLEDATHIITKKKLKMALSPPYLQRHLITLPIIYPQLGSYLKPVLKNTRNMRARIGLTLSPGDS